VLRAGGTPCLAPALTHSGRLSTSTPKVVVRLPGKGNSNTHGARPVHQISSMIKWIRTSRLSTKNSLSSRRKLSGGRGGKCLAAELMEFKIVARAASAHRDHLRSAERCHSTPFPRKLPFNKTSAKVAFQVETKSARKRSARAADTGHSNQHNAQRSTSLGMCKVRCWRWLFGNNTNLSAFRQDLGESCSPNKMLPFEQVDVLQSCLS